MWLFLLFVAMPILEIAVLISAGQRIGFWPVLGLVILTALIGSIALRQQGFATLSKIQRGGANDMTEALTDGLLLMVAGVCLLTPGFVTDGFGLALLAPPVRRYLARALKKRMIIHATHQARQAGESRRAEASASSYAEPADTEHPFAKTRAHRVRRDAEDARVIRNDDDDET